MYVGTDLGATYYWFNCNTGAFVDTTTGADTLNPGNEFLQAPDTGYYAAIIVKPGYLFGYLCLLLLLHGCSRIRLWYFIASGSSNYRTLRFA